jgi:hypothetical protein
VRVVWQCMAMEGSDVTSKSGHVGKTRGYGGLSMHSLSTGKSRCANSGGGGGWWWWGFRNQKANTGWSKL